MHDYTVIHILEFVFCIVFPCFLCRFATQRVHTYQKEKGSSNTKWTMELDIIAL